MEKLSNNSCKLYCYLNLNNPLVLWETYIGRMSSSDYNNPLEFNPISLLHHSILYKSHIEGSHKRIILESRLESIRRQFYTNQVSRITGLFFFENIESAKKAQEEWQYMSHFKDENLVDVGFTYTNISKADSLWLDINYDNKNDDWIHEYWKGSPSCDSPLWEIIVSGVGLIWENSVREIAWRRYESFFPNTLPLLDLSRISFELNRDTISQCKLGRVFPFVQCVQENVYSVKHLIDFRDATNKDFLEKLKHYKGPRNALPPKEGDILFHVPDLRKSDFNFTLPALSVYPLLTTKVPNVNKVDSI